jgi:hypothetical protein
MMYGGVAMSVSMRQCAPRYVVEAVDNGAFVAGWRFVPANRCEQLGFCALHLSISRSEAAGEECTHVIGM